MCFIDFYFHVWFEILLILIKTVYREEGRYAVRE